VNLVEEITIARVIARLNVGGPAIQAILMTDAFRQKGYRTLLLTGEVPPGEASMEYLAEAKDVTPIKIGSMSRRIALYRDLIALYALIRIFRRETPTIVHTHTFHGHIFHGYFSPLLTRLFLAVERFLARHTDCIVAISESQRNELADVYKIAPREKVVIVPLGFDLEPFLRVNGREGSLRSAVSSSRDQPFVGWIGRLTTIKAPGLIIDCAARFKGHPLTPRFVMVGDGDLRQQCEATIRCKGLDEVVSLTGWRRDLPAIYSDLDFVVSTSINEGTPIALLEAMASAKAFVSTDVGGVRDLMLGSGFKVGGMEIFENGILVKSDVGDVAKAVEYLIQNPSRSQIMGQKGREFVRGRFSEVRLADDLEELYQSLAKTKLYSRGGVGFRQEGADATLLSTDKTIT
jgi:glycosyltransferase involved in cell wall biosynthesis